MVEDATHKKTDASGGNGNGNDAAPPSTSCGSNIPLYILTHYRSAVVTVFGLPLSLLWNTVMRARALYVRTVLSAPHLHDQRVQTIVSKVQQRPDKTAPLCTARPGWQSVSMSYRQYKKKWDAIEMPLHDILHIDTETMIVRVEPFVSIGQLTHALNPQGFTLPVVPEMEDLTVGGLINGTGIESSSHQFGLFHEIVTELELCLGDGTIVVATKDNEYQDLFHAIPWSYGTIALLLSAKLQLVPCKKFIKITYEPFHDKEQYIHRLRTLSGEFNHPAPQTEQDREQDPTPSTPLLEVTTPVPMFLEALTYAHDKAVIMSAEFADPTEIPKGATINRIARWYKVWFYKHVETKLYHTTKNQSQLRSSGEEDNNNNNNETTSVEYLPLRDYYHRHSKSLFWEMELMIPIGNNIVFRYLLGWLMPPKVSFLKISQTEMTRQLVEKTHVAQDFLIPTSSMSSFMALCDTEYDQMYPLWLCLHKHAKMPGSLLKDPPNPYTNNGEEEQMYIDIGYYGLPQCVKDQEEEKFNMKQSMQTVCKELVKIKGYQMLYSDIFSNRADFEAMYDHVQYRQIRKKYGAEHCFKEVYDKMHVIGQEKE